MNGTFRAGHRRSGRAMFTALVGAIALTLASCTPELVPSAPRAPDVNPAETQPSGLLGLDLGGTLTGLLPNLTLYRCSTPSFGWATQEVGPPGGVIRVGPHSLVIPPGALDRTVQITASTSAGEHVRVDFQPEGLRFRYPAVLSLSYAHCSSRPLRPSVVYVNDLLAILELLPALNDLDNERVSTRLRHFSGYAIAD